LPHLFYVNRRAACAGCLQCGRSLERASREGVRYARCAQAILGVAVVLTLLLLWLLLLLLLLLLRLLLLLFVISVATSKVHEQRLDEELVLGRRAPCCRRLGWQVREQRPVARRQAPVVVLPALHLGLHGLAVLAQCKDDSDADHREVRWVGTRGLGAGAAAALLR
jgi:hypothetical protein